MHTFMIHTLGCKVNQYDSQVIREELLARGLVETDRGEDADLVIVNTCTVTRHVDAKCRKAARRAGKLNPNALVALTGCYVNRDRGNLVAMPCVDRVFTNEDKPDMVDALLGSAGGPSPAGCSGISGRERAFVKIQDGCENFCSYCIVPFVRGKMRSRQPEDVLAEVRRLAEAGYPEVVITGIHLGQYGRAEGWSFTDLLDRIAGVDGILRVRLSSVDAFDLSDVLIDELAEIGKLCEHFHLPLQSGDAGVLARMRRRYTPAEFLGRIEKLKSAFDRPGITTDIMVGFPGEDEDAFRNTVEMVGEAGFSRIHIFTYSERPGTDAVDMEHKVSPQEAAGRRSRLQEAAEASALEFAEKFRGEAVEVLVEGKPSGNMLAGYSRRYLRMEFPGTERPGTIVRVKLEEPGDAISSGHITRQTEPTCR